MFKSNLNEISREEQKYALENLNSFRNHEKLLLIFLMIILQLLVRLNTKLFIEIEFQVYQHT